MKERSLSMTPHLDSTRSTTLMGMQRNLTNMRSGNTERRNNLMQAGLLMTINSLQEQDIIILNWRDKRPTGPTVTPE